MKRMITIASILLLAAPMALFAGNGRGGSHGSPSGIHTPRTAHPGGVPQGTPGGQRLRDGSGAGTGQKKRQGQQNGQNGQSGQQNGSCANQPKSSN